MEFKDSYLKYEESITEEVFGRIEKVLKDYEVEKYNKEMTFSNFKKYGFIKIYADSSYNIVTRNCFNSSEWNEYKELTISDILGANWDKTESWCVKVTEENMDVAKKYVKQHGNDFALHENAFIGFNSHHISNALSWSEHTASYWDTLLTTEQFYVKIGHIREFKVGDWVTSDKRIGVITKVTNNLVGIPLVYARYMDLDGSNQALKDTNIMAKHLRHATPKEIAKAKGEMPIKDVKKAVDDILDKESLLEEAKRRYPVGTKFRSVTSNCSCVSSGEFEYEKYNSTPCVFTKNMTVWRDGQWAEIINKPEDGCSNPNGYNNREYKEDCLQNCDSCEYYKPEESNIEKRWRENNEFLYGVDPIGEKIENNLVKAFGDIKPRIHLLRKKKLNISINNEVQIKIKKR